MNELAFGAPSLTPGPPLSCGERGSGPRWPGQVGFLSVGQTHVIGMRRAGVSVAPRVALQPSPQEEPEKENSSGPGSLRLCPCRPERIRGPLTSPVHGPAAPSWGPCHLQVPGPPPPPWLLPLSLPMVSSGACTQPSPRAHPHGSRSHRPPPRGGPARTPSRPSSCPGCGQAPPSLGLTQVFTLVLLPGGQGQARRSCGLSVRRGRGSDPRVPAPQPTLLGQHPGVAAWSLGGVASQHLQPQSSSQKKSK